MEKIKTLSELKSPISGEPSVAMMLQKVIDKGITKDNVAALESLVGLYDRMQAKDAERKFNEAFAKLQSELSSVNATRQVPNKDGTPRYRFAPYEDIMAEAKPVLIANGFAVSFTSRFMEGGRMVSICTLRHVGGFSQSNEFAVRIGGGPPGATETQADGAAKTYAKRGALCDALNIVVEHDDDARMIGQAIGSALAGDLAARVEEVGADREAFLKFAGAKTFEEISDERWPVLDELLRRKETAKAAREKLSTEEWK
jgi:ERF superfamily